MGPGTGQKLRPLESKDVSFHHSVVVNYSGSTFKMSIASILLKNHWEEHLKKLTTEFHSLLDICKKDLLVSEYENISKRLNDMFAMQNLARNKH
jgi:hypothetical protein